MTLSKSLSGFGQPFSVTLFRRDLDVWEPGEHNGTFRGNNLAFVTGTVALDQFWRDDALTRRVDQLAEVVTERLAKIAADHPGVQARGRGLIHGLDVGTAERSSAISRAAFDRGLIVETSGPASNVVKLLPPLVVDHTELTAGLDVLAEATNAAYEGSDP